MQLLLAYRNNVANSVLNWNMTRPRALRSLAAATLVASLALTGAASAKVTELGALADGDLGSCPEAGTTPVPVPADQVCQALTKLTGYQAKVGPDRGLYQAPADGRIVAWTIALGKPGPKQAEFFKARYGASSQGAVVVLSPGKKLARTAVAKAPLQKLEPFFGLSVQFPLDRSLPIKKGQYIGLTIPTWAPAMQLGRPSDTSWRSSRDPSGCSDYTTQFGLLGKRTTAGFRCLYKGVRMTYSATFIPTPQASTDD